MFDKINSIYLEKWKDFPGPDIFKYAFAIIGALAWYEFFVPEFKFTNHLLLEMFRSGNAILGMIAFSGIFGVLACAIAFFPTYLHSILKVISK
jgi:hypothetical protein